MGVRRAELKKRQESPFDDKVGNPLRCLCRNSPVTALFNNRMVTKSNQRMLAHKACELLPRISFTYEGHSMSRFHTIINASTSVQTKTFSILLCHFKDQLLLLFSCVNIECLYCVFNPICRYSNTHCAIKLDSFDESALRRKKFIEKFECCLQYLLAMTCFKTLAHVVDAQIILLF